MSASFTPSHEVTVLPDGTTLTYSASGVPEIVAAQGVSTAIESDAAGNRTEESVSGVSVANYTWNDLGQLTAVSDIRTDADVSYGYAGGLRTSATGTNASGTVEDTYAWDTLSGVPLLLSDGTYEYIYGTGTAPIAQVDVATGEVVFLHGDSIGSTRTVTDASGAVVAEFDYGLYGAVSTVSGDGGATRFLFAGEYLDPSGDYYLRNRVYDPASASFLSVDPALASTGMPYAYTAGNPLQSVDPLGLYSWDDFTDDVGGVAGAVWDEVSSPEFIAAAAVGLGCTILTGGTAVVACGALAGGVYNGVAYAANTPPECMSWGGFFLTTGEGALVGALTAGAFGPGGARVLGAVRSGLNDIAPAFLRRSVSSVLGSGAPALRQFATSFQQRVGNLATRVGTALADDTGSLNLAGFSSGARSSNVVDDVMAETLGATQKNITSSYTLTADEALTAGERWVGQGYAELGKPGSGVFRSMDGTRQFRMDASSLMGSHAPGVPHVHLETYAPGARVPSVNNHIAFLD